MDSSAPKPTFVSSNEKESYYNIEMQSTFSSSPSSHSTSSSLHDMNMHKSNLMGKRKGDHERPSANASKRTKKMSSEKSAIESSIASNTPKLSNKGGVKYPFPVKLHHLLEQESSTIVHIISWQPDGRTFRVHDKKALEKDIQNLYFDQSRYASFRRQLNLWGFMRVEEQNGVHDGVYFHPLFQRGDKEMCYSMERLKKGEKKEAAIVTRPEVDRLIRTTSNRLSSGAANVPGIQASQNIHGDLSMAEQNFNSIALNAVDPNTNLAPIMAISSSNNNSNLNQCQEIEQYQTNLKQLQSLEAAVSSLISSLHGSGNNLNDCNTIALQHQPIAQQLLPSYFGTNGIMQDTVLPNHQPQSLFDIQSNLNENCSSVEKLQTNLSDQGEDTVVNATDTTSTSSSFLPQFPILPEEIHGRGMLRSKDESENNTPYSTNFYSPVSSGTPTSSQSEKGQTITSSSSMDSLPLNISWASFSQFRTIGDKMQNYSPAPSPEPFPHDKYLIYEQQADEQVANYDVSAVTLEGLEEILKDLQGKGKCYKNALSAQRG